MTTQGQGHSLTVVQGHSDSTFLNFLFSETTRSIEAKFHMGCGEWKFLQIFQVTWPCQYMVKTSKFFVFGTKRPMTLKRGIHHRVLDYPQCFQMITPDWTWPFLWQCSLTLLYGWQLIQHWVCMHFQVCSNSAYPQHSGGRYRTNGHLVLSSSWCHGLAEACDCGSPWTFHLIC